MTERPEELMSGLDLPRELPSALRQRLETALLGTEARAVRPEVAEALAEALTGDDDLLAGVDGPRPLPPSIRVGLEQRLASPQRRRWAARALWLAGAAAACLVAAVVGASTLGHDSHIRQTTAPGAVKLPLVQSGPGTSAAQPTSNAFDTPAPVPSGAVTGNGATATATPAPAAAQVLVSVSKVAPASGSSAGGNTVVITGIGLTGVTSIEFGDVRSPHFTIKSPSEIDAVAPPHAAGSVDVVVKSGSRASAVEPADRYTYVH